MEKKCVNDLTEDDIFLMIINYKRKKRINTQHILNEENNGSKYLRQSNLLI